MEPTAKPSFNVRTLLITGLILTILNSLILFTIIGKGIYDDFKNKDNKGKIVLANVNPKDAEDITKQLVYNKSTGKDTEYYSPALDALLKYDSGQYFLNESSNYVGFSEKGLFNFDRFAYVKLYQGSTKPSDVKEQELKKLYTDVKKEEEGTVEGLAFAKFSYVRSSFTNKQEKSILKQTVIYRAVGSDYLVAEITYPNNDNVTEYSSDLAQVLNSIELHPKNIASDIKVVIPNGGVEVTYDKSDWLVDSKNESYAYLSYRSAEKETNAEFKYTVTSVSISTDKIYNEETIAQRHTTYRSYDADFYKTKNYKLLKDAVSTKINDQTFVMSEYSYTFAGDPYKSQLYTGLSLDSKYQINIKTLTPVGGSMGETAIKSLINDVQLVKSQEEQVTSQLMNTEGGVVMGTSSLEIDKSAIIGKPAVVHIFNKTCVEVAVSPTAGFIYTKGKTYTECSGGLGTGFYVSSDGYVITNGHVANPDPMDIVIQGLYSTGSVSPFWKDFIYDVLAALQQQGYSASTLSSLTEDQLITVLYGAFINLYDQKAITLTATSKNYIEKDKTFEIDRTTLSPVDPSAYYQTEIVESHVDSLARASYNQISGKPSQISQPDIALLKIDGSNKNTPILRLSEADLLSVGLPINVIGFPGAANNSLLFSSDATAIATITKGSISAIKPSANQNFKLIQIDATISHGNSGGPILNSDGEVVGIATYKISTTDSADFNAGVSVEEVQKLLSKNNVSAKSNDATAYINSGVNNLQKEYYKLALADFKKAKDAYPKSAEVLDPLINISNDKIKNGEDKTPLFNTYALETKLNDLGINVKGNMVLVLLIAGIGLVLSLVLSGALLIVRMVKNRSQKPPVFGNPVLPTDKEMNTVSDVPQSTKESAFNIPTKVVSNAIEQPVTPMSMPNVQPVNPPVQPQPFAPTPKPIIPSATPKVTPINPVAPAAQPAPQSTPAAPVTPTPIQPAQTNNNLGNNQTLPPQI